jgi:hypothetical protein
MDGITFMDEIFYSNRIHHMHAIIHMEESTQVNEYQIHESKLTIWMLKFPIWMKFHNMDESDFHPHNFIHAVALLLMRFTLSYFYNGIPLIYVINFIHTCHVALLCFDFIHVMKFNHIFWLYPCGSIFIQVVNFFHVIRFNLVVILHSCIHYKHIIPHQFHPCKNIIPYQFHPCNFYHIQYYPLYSPHFIQPLGIIHVYYGIVLIFKILQINNVAFIDIRFLMS